MENIIDTPRRELACFQVADITSNHREPAPLIGADRLFNLLQVLLAPGGVVIETNDVLVALKQSFEQIRTDETRYPGEQPCAHTIYTRTISTAAACRSFHFEVGVRLEAGVEALLGVEFNMLSNECLRWIGFLSPTHGTVVCPAAVAPHSAAFLDGGRQTKKIPKTRSFHDQFMH